MEIKANQNYIVRTASAGIFFGKVKEYNKDEITMMDVRKIWYWDGACAVEQLALDGVTKPDECKLTVVISEMVITEPIQIIPCTEKASKILSEIKIWKR